MSRAWNLFEHPSKYVSRLLDNPPRCSNHAARDDRLLQDQIVRVLRNERIWRNIRYARILYYWMQYYVTQNIRNPLKRQWRNVLVRLRIVDNAVQPMQPKEELLDQFAKQAMGLDSRQDLM